ncbi:MAG: ABC transporter substrate-binding protein [Gaiellaceae bacterium]
MLRSRTRRFWAVLTTVPLCILLLAVASTASGGASTHRTSAQTTITVGLITSPSADAIQKLAPQFTKKTGIKVKFVVQDWASGHQKYLLAFKSHQGLYDVIQFDDPYLGAFAAGHFLQPLDSMMNGSAAYDAKDIPAPIRQYGKIKGVTYALDLSSEPYLYWYRTDIFSKLHLKPAKTWDQYVTLAQKIQASGLGSGNTMGFAQSGSLPYHWFQLLWSAGGDMVDKNGHVNVTSAAAVKATNQLVALEKAAPSSALSGTDDDAVSEFCQQNVGQLMSFSGYWPVVHDKTKCKPWNKFATTTVPRGAGSNVSLLEGWHMGLPSDSKNKQAAWTFAEWLLGKANAANLLNAGAAAIARQSLLSNAALVKKYPYLPTLLATAKIARPAYRYSTMPQITQEIANDLQNIMTGQTSVANGLKTMQGALSKILKNTPKS